MTPLDVFIKKHPAPAGMTKKQWATMSIAQRENTVFATGIENMRVMQRLVDLMRDAISGTRETLPNGKTVMKVQGKSDFVAQARDFMVSEGLLEADDRNSEKYNKNVRNAGSLARLRLIFDVQTKKANSFARWERGWDPDVLNRYPAGEFVRYPGAKIKRMKHEFNEGAIRLKTDFAFWALDMNSLDIGGFLTPWAPYGFNSFMDMMDVPRERAVKLGLIKQDESLTAKDLSKWGTTQEERVNYGVSASLNGVEKELKDKLLKKLKERYGQAKVDRVNGVELPYLRIAKMAREEANEQNKKKANLDEEGN